MSPEDRGKQMNNAQKVLQETEQARPDTSPERRARELLAPRQPWRCLVLNPPAEAERIISDLVQRGVTVAQLEDIGWRLLDRANGWAISLQAAAAAGGDA